MVSGLHCCVKNVLPQDKAAQNRYPFAFLCLSLGCFLGGRFYDLVPGIGGLITKEDPREDA